MGNLVKIRELSLKYDISARTLRYYEDMGLIKSIRSDDYAYRLYDETAIKRLEQILILRRLNISIKDIKRIFSTTGSEVVLDVLGKKVDNIDEEVSLLHELKKIVLEFIAQIKRVDFEKETDIKLLYEKAKDVETQITNTDYSGNSSIAERFFDITDFKLGRKHIMIFICPLFLTLLIFCAKITEILNGYGALKTKLQRQIRRLIKLSNTPADYMLLR